MRLIRITAAIDLAWRQGDTAATIGSGTSANPYHHEFAYDCHTAWDRGWHGYPLDERGGFAAVQAVA
jgi:hypothetical protein